MLNPGPQPSVPIAPAQRLEQVFRNVLQTPEGRHLLKLMLQYRQGPTP